MMKHPLIYSFAVWKAGMAIFLLLITACQPPAGNKQYNLNKPADVPEKRVSDVPMQNGFNTAGIFYQFRNGYPPEGIIPLYKGLQADMMRFPGGTLANHYRYSRTGYGRGLKADEQYDRNFIRDFALLMKQISDAPRVIYVLNIFEHFTGPEEDGELLRDNLQAIRYLRRNGVEVVAVEIGNELYIYPEVTKNWLKRKNGLAKMSEENVDRYLDLARQYTDSVRAIDPDIKLGLPLGNFSNPLHRYWNQRLLKADFAEAFICHFYGHMDPACQEAACGEDLEKYINKMANTILIIKEKTGKEVWVTEWNSINFGFQGDKHIDKAHSPLHLEYNDRFLETYDRTGVEIAIYHRLSGSPLKPAYNLINVYDDQRLETLPAYEQFRSGKH